MPASLELLVTGGYPIKLHFTIQACYDPQIHSSYPREDEPLTKLHIVLPRRRLQFHRKSHTAEWLPH